MQVSVRRRNRSAAFGARLQDTPPVGVFWARDHAVLGHAVVDNKCCFVVDDDADVRVSGARRDEEIDVVLGRKRQLVCPVEVGAVDVRKVPADVAVHSQRGDEFGKGACLALLPVGHPDDVAETVEKRGRRVEQAQQGGTVAPRKQFLADDEVEVRRRQAPQHAVVDVKDEASPRRAVQRRDNVNKFGEARHGGVHGDVGAPPLRDKGARANLRAARSRAPRARARHDGAARDRRGERARARWVFAACCALPTASTRADLHSAYMVARACRGVHDECRCCERAR